MVGHNELERETREETLGKGQNVETDSEEGSQ